MSSDTALLINTIQTASMMVFLISMFFAIYYGGKLQIYLSKTNPFLYENLGPHGRRTSLPIIFWALYDTSLEDEDRTIAKYKKKIKPAIKIGVVALIVLLISSIFYTGPVSF